MVLSKFMILCLAAFIAILGCMWLKGRGMDNPASFKVCRHIWMLDFFLCGQSLLVLGSMVWIKDEQEPDITSNDSAGRNSGHFVLLWQVYQIKCLMKAEQLSQLKTQLVVEQRDVKSLICRALSIITFSRLGRSGTWDACAVANIQNCATSISLYFCK